jgi:hypothetical protein
VLQELQLSAVQTVMHSVQMMHLRSSQMNHRRRRQIWTYPSETAFHYRQEQVLMQIEMQEQKILTRELLHLESMLILVSSLLVQASVQPLGLQSLWHTDRH